MKANKARSCRWEHFSHDADIGIRGYGDTIETAFSQAAIALTAVISEVDSVTPLIPREISCEAPDYELLFVDWINALIYEMAIARMLFSRFDIRISKTALQATVLGELIDWSRHHPAVEAKGATYTELKVTQGQNGQWMAQCVIDV
jgi:SHS2 domain-containing protein